MNYCRWYKIICTIDILHFNHNSLLMFLFFPNCSHLRKTILLIIPTMLLVPLIKILNMDQMSQMLNFMVLIQKIKNLEFYSWDYAGKNLFLHFIYTNCYQFFTQGKSFFNLYFNLIFFTKI